MNGAVPARELLEHYAAEAEMVENDLRQDSRIFLADVMDSQKVELEKANPQARLRAFIRHDPQKLASELMKIVTAL